MAMDKKKLRKIRIQAPTEPFKDLLKTIRLEKYKVSLINAYSTKGLLILDFYNQDALVYYRIYQSKDDYIGLEFNYTNKKLDRSIWRAGSLEYLKQYTYVNHERLPLLRLGDMSSTKAIIDYLGAPENCKEINPIEIVKDKQEEIRAVRLKSEHQKIKDEIDKDMNPIRAVPKDFEKWINDVALFESRYIIYGYKSSGTMQGYCTHCKHEMTIGRPKHNEQGICPNCKSKVTFKASGKMGTISDKSTAQLLQRHPKGLVHRHFSIHKTYKSKDKGRGSKLSFIEINRIILADDPEDNKYYAWDKFKSTNETRWCDDKIINIGAGRVYIRNLSDVIKGTAYQYSAITQYLNNDDTCYLPHYFSDYYNGPALEYIVKLGLINIASDIINGYRGISHIKGGSKVNLKGKRITEVLELSNTNVKRAIKLNVNAIGLRLLQIAQEKGIRVNDEDVNSIARSYYDLEQFLELSTYSNVYQLNKYLVNNTIRFIDYIDYISMAKELGWDMSSRFILFPRHFTEAHDQVVKLTKVKENHEENKAILESYKRLSGTFNYRDEDYLIQLPKSVKEVIREGQKLHHCVGTYTKDIAEGKTLVIFIRKTTEPYNPYYTMELDPESLGIIQVRGKRNINPTEEVNIIVDKYKQYLAANKMNIAI